jgi:hypothetical protein
MMGKGKPFAKCAFACGTKTVWISVHISGCNGRRILNILPKITRKNIVL